MEAALQKAVAQFYQDLEAAILKAVCYRRTVAAESPVVQYDAAGSRIVYRIIELKPGQSLPPSAVGWTVYEPSVAR